MDFKKTILVHTSKEKAFNAVTHNVNKWWGNVDNTDVSKMGDEFSIFFEEGTEWRFSVTKLDQFNKVAWKCIYANHSYGGIKGIKEEWLNSEIHFAFKDLAEDSLEISFEHKGLTPDLNCYEMCDAGWTHFITNSLKRYLETGIGAPNLVEPIS